MQIINYVHKVQGIDKVVPLLVCMKRINPGINVHTVLDIERKALNQIPNDLLGILRSLGEVREKGVQGFFPSILSHSDEWLPKWLLRIAELLAFGELSVRRQLNGLVKTPEGLILICIDTAKYRSIGRLLGKLVRSQGGEVVTYLKSVHDQGRGLTVVGKAKREEAKDFSSLLLVPNARIRDVLVNSGYSEKAFLNSGYPPLYEFWREFAAVKAFETFPKFRDKDVVVIFSRGPVGHKQDDSQILTAEIEKRLTLDIIAAVRQLWPNAVIWIKPHPYQNLGFLESVEKSTPEVEIHHESVQLLSAIASVAISTYSSASLEPLAHGKPSIEYFEETPNFLEAHPSGSVFGHFGVRICRSPSELKRALVDARNISADEREELTARLIDKFEHEENVQNVLTELQTRLDLLR